VIHVLVVMFLSFFHALLIPQVVLRTLCRRAVGIELVDDRMRIALGALEALIGFASEPTERSQHLRRAQAMLEAFLETGKGSRPRVPEHQLRRAEFLRVRHLGYICTCL
jgi:hypothetical protein